MFHGSVNAKNRIQIKNNIDLFSFKKKRLFLEINATNSNAWIWFFC